MTWFLPLWGACSITDDGLVLHLDADEIAGLSNNDPISTWSDLTANGNDATAASTDRPLYVEDAYGNNRPAVQFATTAHRLDVAADASLDNANCTYIIVAKMTQGGFYSGGSNSRWLFNKKNTNPATMALRLSDDGFECLYREDGSEGTVNTLVNSAAYPDQALNVHAVRFDGTTGTYDVFAVEDGTRRRVASASAGDIDADSGGILSIGNHPTTDNLNDVNMFVFKVLVYNRALSDAELSSIECAMANQYPTPWRKKGKVFGATEHFSASIWIDGTTAYLTYVPYPLTGAIGYMTADTSDPHNWTDHGTIFTHSANVGRARLLRYSGTWYLYYDDRTIGTIRVATGASIGALADYGSNPILSGSGTDWETYVRLPYVVSPDESHDSNWQMLYDGRDTTVTSGVGAIGHATSPDGLSWTRDAANNPVIDATGNDNFEANDTNGPTFHWDGSQYVVFWAGYRELWNSDYPHMIARGTTTDLTGITRDTDYYPILNLDQSAATDEGIATSIPAIYPISPLSLYYTGFTSSSDQYIHRAEYTP